jgi:hypothetical protein
MRRGATSVSPQRPTGWYLSRVAVLLAFASSAPADVFHLTTGGRIEGELLAEQEDHYEILTTLGTVRLPRDSVARVEAGPTPFAEYRQLQQQAADTPAAHVALAAWCAAHGLPRERERHLRRALEIDPEFTPARRALGQVRVGDVWINPPRHAGSRRTETPAPQDAQTPEELAQLAAAIQLSWQRQIQAIKSSLLDSVLPTGPAEGRRRILEIQDPLAIAPLVRVLGVGDLSCRLLLLDALRQFPDDAATANLAALALADPSRDVRRAAVSTLTSRRDPRVVAQFRAALETGDDALVRRAAEGLGALRAREAVPELIDALTALRHRMVEVRANTYQGNFSRAFTGGYTQIGSLRVPVGVHIGVAWPGPPVPNQEVLMEVTVYRSEVLEALRKITGTDFGFDQTAWARWYEEYGS